MKLQPSNNRTSAWSRVELAVVLVVIAILVLIFVFTRHHQIHRQLTGNSASWKSYCVNNLKEDFLAIKIWSGDNGDKFPMQVSAKVGGAMEPVATGNVVPAFQVMSNELSSTKNLLCPADASHVPVAGSHTFPTDFQKLTKDNISYFVSVTAASDYPDSIVMGDDNFLINGAPIKSGLTDISPETRIDWSSERHHNSGNIAFSDGSVWTVDGTSLRSHIQQSAQGTNCIAVP